MRGNRTKILATLGPATSTPWAIRWLLHAGVDAFRLNAAHGTVPEKLAVIRAIREAESSARAHVPIVLDLSGPKIRTWATAAPSVTLERGSDVLLTSKREAVTGERIAIDTPAAIAAVRRGDRILLDDGKIELRAVARRRGAVAARVVEGGALSSRKGVNFPDTLLPLRPLTGRDRRILGALLHHGIDAVALSFVQRASDLEPLRRALARARREIPVIAKIEKPEALRNLLAIIAAADGVMVARGDLGVELSLAEVPAAQKRIIHESNRAGRFVITATQMIESMIESPVPTRAEASDIANAVFDGTDALMLSGETAVGRYPVAVVRAMDAIAREAEKVAGTYARPADPDDPPTFTVAIARAAVAAGRRAGAEVILVLTRSGDAARAVAKRAAGLPVVAVTGSVSVARSLGLYRGVRAVVTDLPRDVEGMIAAAEGAVISSGLLTRGATVVVATGEQHHSASGHLVKIHRLGAG